MSSIPVYTGFWHDYTRDGAYGWTLTLNVKWSALLVSALSTFVAIVAGSFWSLLAFVIHQWRARPGEEDGVYFQQQVVYRNPMSTWGAIVELFKIWGAWRSRRRGRAAPRRLVRRSFLFLLPPLVVVAGFTAAGIFVGDVTRPTYEGNNVKIKPVNCGIVSFNNTVSPYEIQAPWLKYVNDTLAARAYARSCYGSTATPAVCGEYPKQSLPYNQANVTCPFGEDPTGKSLCSVNLALSLDSGLLDTSDYLGINVPKKDRLLFRRSSTCSPINVLEYAELNNATDSAAFPVYDYYLGPIDGQTNFTFEYNTQLAHEDAVPYLLTSLDSTGGWTPIFPLQVNNADTALLLLTSNSVEYLTSVEDPWFKATTTQNNSGSGPISEFYKADSYVGAMACMDQYQLCNPSTSPYSCTILGGIEDMFEGYSQIKLNPYQTATALRLLGTLAASSTYSIVNYLSGSWLFAQERLIGIVSTSLPSNQWQIEFQGWFETSLAKIQALTVSYPMQPANLKPYGWVSPPDAKGSPVDRAAYSLCSNQRVRNVESYQSFSGLGLVIIVVLGSLIIILSLTVETCVAELRKRRRTRYHPVNSGEIDGGGHDHREVARIADRMLQLQRMALMTAKPQTKWKGRMSQVPYTADPEMLFPQPVRVIEGDFRYGRGGDTESDGVELKEQGENFGEEDQQQHGSSMLSQAEEQAEEEAATDPGSRQEEDPNVPLITVEADEQGAANPESPQVENPNVLLITVEADERGEPNIENHP